MFESGKRDWKEGGVEGGEERRSGVVRSEWERTQGRYVGAVCEWREPCALLELSSASLVVPLSRTGISGAVGKS